MTTYGAGSYGSGTYGDPLDNEPGVVLDAPRATITWIAYPGDVVLPGVSLDAPAPPSVTWTAYPGDVIAGSALHAPAPPTISWTAYPGTFAESAGDPIEVVKSRTGISLQMLDRYDWTENLGFPLTTFADCAWVDEVYGEGEGGFRLPMDHGLLASGHGELALGNLVACSYNGLRPFTFRIERSEPVTISEGEDAGRWWTVQGPGLFGVLDDGIVLPSTYDPALGIERLTADQRPFTFAARDYDETTDNWTAPSLVKGVALRGLEPFRSAPRDWPDMGAIWISSPLLTHLDEFGDSPDARLLYFRKGFTLDQVTTVSLFAAAAGDIEIYIDGDIVLEADGRFRTAEAEVRLAAGAHQLAARYRPARGQTSGVVVSMGEQTGVDDDEEPVYDWLLRTSGDWSVLTNVNPPPGFTAGRILRLLTAGVRDFATHVDMPSTLQQVKLGFDDAVDSAGLEWAERTDRYWQLGTSLLDVALELAESACEVRMSPYGRLKAYGGECGQDLSASVRFNDNIIDYGHTIQWARQNFILGRYAHGWMQRLRRTLDGDGNPYHLKMGFASWGTADSHTEAVRLTNTAFNVGGRSWGRRVTVIDPIGGPHPYADYDNGDYVSAPTEDEVFERHRIVALGCRQDMDGNVTFTPDLVYSP